MYADHFSVQYLAIVEQLDSSLKFELNYRMDIYKPIMFI